MNRVKKIEKYIAEFFSERFERLDWFYRTTHEQRTHGIYQLKQGTDLMDFLISIHSNVEDHLYFDRLIPQKFVAPDNLFSYLGNFKVWLNEHQHLLDINFQGEDTDYIVTETQKIKNDLVNMIDYVKHIYDWEDTNVPYQDLRYSLLTKNIPAFIGTLKSILATVSYSIERIHEGYFHANVHLILRLLGFDILSEEPTNNGRIDAVIRFSDLIYIVEFKFGQENDLSRIAMDQIHEKDYAQKFQHEHKEIIGIGVSFDEAERNINGFVFEQLSE
jgi:hypothetical protein